MTTQLPQADIWALLQTSIRDPLPESATKLLVSLPPFLPVPHALNLRTISSPSLLGPNVIFRSGSLSHLSEPVLSALRTNYNITTIFDLRSQKEREKVPSPSIEGIKTTWISSTAHVGRSAGSILDAEAVKEKNVLTNVKVADFAQKNGKVAFVKMYGNLLFTQKDAYRGVFEMLRDSKSGILFHCTAGKDRTGVLAALILALVGASDEEIEQDYLLTRVGVEPFREHLMALLLQQLGKTSLDEPGISEMCGVTRHTILAFLQWMNERWGGDRTFSGTSKYFGVEGYLRDELGLKAEDVEKIRSNLKATAL
jgi:protein tyrosine/serine phosphatase